jgi:DNA-directed RNA polymerase specialized sigma24 family protein
MANDHRPSLQRLERAASRLRPLEYWALLLSARDGLTNDEIAARLGVSPVEAERLVAAALCRIDRALERREPGWWRSRRWWRRWRLWRR